GGTPLSGVSLRPSGRTPPGSRKNCQTDGPPPFSGIDQISEPGRCLLWHSGHDPMPLPDARQPLLISVDFEDWHQLVHRRVGAAGWERPGPALERQTRDLLDLFDELGIRATFFVLGMA